MDERNDYGSIARTEEVVDPINFKEIPHDITIHSLNRGFVVDVGCQRVAFTSKDGLIEHIAMYIREPNITAKSYIKKEILNY